LVTKAWTGSNSRYAYYTIYFEIPVNIPEFQKAVRIFYIKLSTTLLMMLIYFAIDMVNNLHP